jgi:hypothetical protein
MLAAYEANRAYWREYMRQYMATYRATHPAYYARELAACRMRKARYMADEAYRAENARKAKAWADANREHVRARNREYMRRKRAGACAPK